MRKFNTIEQVEAHNWVGSHNADRQEFNMVYAFIDEHRGEHEIVARAVKAIVENGMDCDMPDETAKETHDAHFVEVDANR